MRYTLLILALTGAAFAQYHVPTEGETLVPVSTTENISLATTTVLVTVTSVANPSAIPTTTGPTIVGGTPESLWTYQTIPTGAMTEPGPGAPVPSAPDVPVNASSTLVVVSSTGSNATVIVTSIVTPSTEASTVIVTSAQSHSRSGHTTSATASASTAGAGEFVKPGALAMVAGVLAALI